MIETLSNIQPLLLIAMLITMYSIETVRPYLAKPADKKRHDTYNFIIAFIAFAINGAVSLAIIFSLTYTHEHQLGLLNQLALPALVEIIVGMLLIDFGSYLLHNLQHKIPLLWRIHRVHHSDPHLNASSSLRFHPFDVFLAQGVFPFFWIPLMGISITSFVLYGTIALPLIVVQHTNVRFPDWLERYGRLVISTPGWHKIHHSDEQQFTDSHYGDVFTFWDRLFGTWHHVQPHEIRYGLKEFRDTNHHTVSGQLLMPFVKR